MLERTIDFILLIPRHLIYGSDNAVSHFCENHVDKYSLLSSIHYFLHICISIKTWRTCQNPHWYVKLLFAMTFSGWVATLAGWYVTEIGRQPYLVTGVLKTKDAVTSTPAEHIALSLTLYIALYVFLLIAYIRTLYVMADRAVKLEQGDEPTAKSPILNNNQPAMES